MFRRYLNDGMMEVYESAVRIAGRFREIYLLCGDGGQACNGFDGGILVRRCFDRVSS